MVNRREAIDVVAPTITDLLDDEFNESEEELFDFDVFDRARANLNGLNMDDIEVGKLFDSDDFDRLNSVPESDSDGQNWPEFNSDSDMNNPKLEVGMLFSTKVSLKETVWQYDRLNSYFIKFPKSDQKRLKAVSNSNCSWYIWASRLHLNDPIDQN
ncbi:hypothetical protein J1N35_029315 [Gossypium stocksii]|uniref:Transposase MuDR plant domain-containing protein n=1 Tax=Gossypium stocksii TaxID=47602 RepID=A0A9D3ZT09_9ROSI|nr:hypothetical protein J1N35_029315 [Gossypium stocksii]